MVSHPRFFSCSHACYYIKPSHSNRFIVPEIPAMKMPMNQVQPERRSTGLQWRRSTQMSLLQVTLSVVEVLRDSESIAKKYRAVSLFKI